MDKLGFIRVAAAVPVVSIADPYKNCERICELIDRAVDKSAALVLFPRLCLTGSTCGDLLRQTTLLETAEEALDRIVTFTEGLPVTVVINTVLSRGGRIGECNVVINDGEILSIVFEGDDECFSINGAIFSFYGEEYAHILLHPASEAEDIFRADARKRIISAQTENNASAYVFCNAGYGESTTDYVFAGSSLIYENGELLAEGEEFSHDSSICIADIDFQKLAYLRSDEWDSPLTNEMPLLEIDNFPETEFDKNLYRKINPNPFLPQDDGQFERAFKIQSTGLASRLQSIGCRKAVIGISGGLDSTLALLCTVKTFDEAGWDRTDITGITMPGFGTSSRTHDNASELMEQLGITHREVDITQACRQHLKDIGHDGKTQDSAFENAQARERTQILMDTANMENAIVIGTGDLSELALGWCTFNGDHMSNYAVNASIPKTLVRAMVSWAAEHLFDGRISAILKDIVDTPVSPELTGKGGEISQKTEDIVGPYELHDFFIFNFMVYGFAPEKIAFLAEKAFEGRFSNGEIKKWLELFVKRFFSQQFKRSCAPDGPQVSQVSFSPRTGWSMPSDAVSRIWRNN